MIKGWRNDPKWVELYARRDEKRIERQVSLMKMEFMTQQMIDEARRMAAESRPNVRLV